MQLLWEFWRNRSQNRRRLQLFGNWLMIWSLTQHYSYFDLFRRCRGDCCWWNLWVNVYFECILRVFEHFLISYDERSFGSRGSVVDAESDYIDCIVYCIWMQYCWWKFWDFWIWNESILALPLPHLTSAYPHLLRRYRGIIVDKISE